MTPVPPEEERCRLDTWLWAARFYKTRALAGEEISGGKIHVNGLRARPGRSVHVGELVEIRKEGVDMEVKVVQLAQKRGPASVAVTLYAETERGLLMREQSQQRAREVRLSQPRFDAGRPTKRDRRHLERLKGDG